MPEFIQLVEYRRLTSSLEQLPSLRDSLVGKALPLQEFFLSATSLTAPCKQQLMGGKFTPCRNNLYINWGGGGEMGDKSK